MTDAFDTTLPDSVSADSQGERETGARVPHEKWDQAECAWKPTQHKTISLRYLYPNTFPGVISQKFIETQMLSFPLFLDHDLLL